MAKENQILYPFILQTTLPKEDIWSIGVSLANSYLQF